MQNEGYFIAPKWLFGEEYSNVSNDAKLLYWLLLNRVSLSARNNFYDDDGKIYIFFTRKEASKILNVSIKKAGRIFKELICAGLLREKRQGRGKCNLLYVLTGQGDFSREDGKIFQERTNCPARNTEYNNTENNNTENQSVCQWTDGQADELFLEQIKNQSEVEIFHDDIRILFENAIDRIYYSDKLKIGGAILPRSKLRSLLTTLTADALISVHDNLRAMEKPPKRPIYYVMSAIINAIAENNVS